MNFRSLSPLFFILISALGLLFFPAATSAQEFSRELQARIPAADLAEMQQMAAEHGQVLIIAELALPEGRPDYQLSTQERSAQRSRIAQLQDALLSEQPRIASEGAGVRRFTVLPYISFAADRELLESLARSPLVARIHYNRPEPPLMTDAARQVGASAAWDLGFTGAGQTVVVLDTGAELTHEAFDGKIVAEACFSRNFPDLNSTSLCPDQASSSFAAGSAADCDVSVNGCGHGTHVAGIAVGNSASLLGIAYEANLIPIQVFSRFDNTSPSLCGSNNPCVLSYTEDQMFALQHVFNLSLNNPNLSIASVNMSLGGGGVTAYCEDDPRRLIIENLTGAGIPVVIASGNNGFTNALSFPACIEKAVSVGALTKFNSVTNFSNSADFLDVLAPGALISSAVVGNGYGLKSGTSMAAPVVAGAFAVLRERFPTASTDSLLTLMKDTGRPVTDHRNGLTHPALSLQNVFPAEITLPAAPLELLATPGNPVGTASFSIGNTGVSPLEYRLRNLVPADPALVLHRQPEAGPSRIFSPETHPPKNTLSATLSTGTQAGLQTVTDFSTSFEADEGFTAGFIHNQNGWTTTNGSAVSMPAIGTGRALSGTQALQLGREGSLVTGVRSPQFTPSGDVVRYRADIFVESAGWSDETATYSFNLRSESAQLLRVELLNTGLIRRRLGSGTTVSTGLYYETGSWQRLEVVYDGAQEEIRLYYGSELLHTYTGPITTYPTRFEFLRSNRNQPQSAWVDNVVAESLLPGFTASSVSGSVDAGGSESISLSFDAAGYGPGRYTGSIEISSNDLSAPTQQLDWQLDVHGVFTAEIGAAPAQQSSGWRLLSTPVATSLADLLDPLWTQGAAGSNHPGSDQPNVFMYNGSSYVVVTDLINTILPAGGSVAVYVFARDTPGADSPETWPKQLSVTGLDPQETVTAGLQNLTADGFSLIGNPFAAPVSSDDFLRSGVRTPVWVYDHNFSSGFDDDAEEGPAGAGGGWRVWNGSAGSLTDGLIAPFQSFFVQNEASLSGAPSLQIPRAARRDTGGTLFQTPGEPHPTAPQLQLAARLNGSLVSDLWLGFSESGDAGPAPDDMLMLYPLDYGSFLGMYTAFGGQALTLKQLPLSWEGTLEIPLHFEGWQPGTGGYAPLGGEVELIWPDLSTLPPHWHADLLDTHTGEVTPLRDAQRYVFTIDGEAPRQLERPAFEGPAPFLWGRGKVSRKRLMRASSCSCVRAVRPIWRRERVMSSRA